MLGLFDNTLTADDKYSRHKRENFAQKNTNTSIPKAENFFSTFNCLSEIYIKWWVFWNKNESHSLNIFEIVGSERGGYVSV